MKKTFLLVVACVFTFIGAQAQSSEVEAVNQLTKAEQFKEKNNFIKETLIYKYATGATELNPNGLVISVILLTDLKSGEQVAVFEFGCEIYSKSIFNNPYSFIGYLDIDQVDDLILALETISNEFENSDPKDKCTISYTTSDGIDIFSTRTNVTFRKKWLVTNEYGTQSYKYGDSVAIIRNKNIEKVISSIKEAQMIAKQSLRQ